MLLALLVLGGSLLLSGFLTWLIHLFFFRGRRRGVVLALAATLALFCVKPTLDRLVFWHDLGAFAADEIRPKALVLPPGALLWIDSNYAGGSCGWGCPLDELPFVTRLEAPNVFQPGLDPENPAILDLRQFLDAPERTQPFGFRYAFISLGAFEYADAAGIPKSRQEAWPDYPMGVHMLVEVPENGLLDLRHGRVHFRRFAAQRDVGSYLMFGGLIDESVVMPDVQGMVRDLVRVSRAE